MGNLRLQNTVASSRTHVARAMVEVTYWFEQSWQYALLAAVAIIRQCAEHSATPLYEFVSDLAAASAIDIS